MSVEIMVCSGPNMFRVSTVRAVDIFIDGNDFFWAQADTWEEAEEFIKMIKAPCRLFDGTRDVLYPGK